VHRITDADDLIPAAYTASILDEQARRDDERATAKPVLFADELLPGVGDAPLSFREGLAKGGLYTYVVLTILNSLDELESGVFNVLGPEIQQTFGVSDGAIVFLGTASIAFFVLGAVPFGWLADRTRRPPLVGFASLFFGAFSVLCGLAANAFMMFWTRLGSGVSKANTLTVHASLLADTYPIGVRGRLFSTSVLIGRTVGLSSPILAGVIADAAGADGWRWAFIILGLPVAAFALLAFRMPEPPRGQWEQKDVLGTSLPADDLTPSIEAGFARLWKIATLRTLIVAFAAMGFYLFTGQTIMYLYLEEHFGLDATERGGVGSVLGVGVLVVAPFIGRYFDRVFRVDPSKALAVIGVLLLPVAVIVPIQYAMPNLALFVLFAGLATGLMGGAFSVVSAVTQSVVPYRLRGLGQAMVTLYIFLLGGIGAGLVGALITDALGERTAVVVLSVPAMLVGGLLILRSATLIRADMSLIVSDLRDELDEYRRQEEHPDQIPALQLQHVDFAYGSVQVLFDLSLEVRQGETLALLGTNGAGKSTIVNVIAGLAIPERGVVRLNGRTVTYTTPEQRARLGIQVVPGGKGVFPSLSVEDNLVVGAFAHRRRSAEVGERISRVLELFPVLADRIHQPADQLSGGQQQMLAFARAMLHDPEVLVIDELSLGLAPNVVQTLLELVERLQARGQTMIIVEQSLNVAVSIADRAVFVEKGRVRFDGPARQLAVRDDLARAVFFGADVGPPQ
jgi:ABC-type branched-subunit amino acid transport system ATPase component/predicted MFS family arabinose efflux permease